ncbi:MAG: zinc ABC transporter substrate-binding protein [Desulfovibrio sp.]|uniref:metal ABC transporter substrate-binding protein n=1 Tax=Desulfovibrio sp. TaxID=885 RepID=UPI00135D63FF|nr:metal ABC transporter substrate-binding protein [Desulfovibrio sp.]MTJ93021.1 zinc ABC transporter substrate-binding protein [Desulfovibrio sp.]
MSNCISALFCKGKQYALLLACTLLATFFAVANVAAAEPRVRVLATTYPVYLITRAVTQSSPDVQVDLLIPAQTGCPHDYALTPKDMQKLAKARIVVINGLGLEAFLEKPLAAAGKITVVDSSKGVNAIAEDHDEGQHAAHGNAEAAHKDDHAPAAAAKGHEAEHGHGHGNEHGHDHGGVNPHAFASPIQAAIMARNIGRELAAAEPLAAKNCPETAEAYAAKLEALGKRLAAVGANAANKNVVALHDGMAYLVRDAGLNLVDVIQEDEEAQPSAARLLDLVKKIKDSKPVVLIGEPQYSDKPVRALSAETGVPAVQLDSLASGAASAPLDHYETVMTRNCDILEKYFAK